MDISIIVCTRDRARHLRGCLEAAALAIRRTPEAEVELVVVDNGSRDDTRQVLEAWRREGHPELRMVYEPRPGLSIARNTGLRVSQGRLIAFTDDDCRFDPNYLTDLLRHDRADGDLLVLRGGRVELGDPRDQPFTILIRDQARRHHRRRQPVRDVDLNGLILGCNLSCRRELLERIGLFDERFGVGGPLRAGEDTDLLFRAYLAGAWVEYVPDMAVRHFHGRREPGEIRRLLGAYDEGAGAVYAKFWWRAPGLCRQFRWDLANAARELIGAAPPLGFGHKYRARVASMLRGACRYWALQLTGATAHLQPHPALSRSPRDDRPVGGGDGPPSGGETALTARPAAGQPQDRASSGVRTPELATIDAG